MSWTKMAMLCNRGTMVSPSVQLSKDELREENAEHHRSCEEYQQHGPDEQQRHAAAFPSRSGLLKVLLQQGHVPVVRFPGDIEQVTQKRNQAHRGVESDVCHHAGDDRPWRTQSRGLKNQITGEQRAYHVSESRNQADQGIEPKAVAGAWNDKGAIEQAAQGPEIFQLRRSVRADQGCSLPS